MLPYGIARRVLVFQVSYSGCYGLRYVLTRLVRRVVGRVGSFLIYRAKGSSSRRCVVIFVRSGFFLGDDLVRQFIFPRVLGIGYLYSSVVYVQVPIVMVRAVRGAAGVV